MDTPSKATLAVPEQVISQPTDAPPQDHPTQKPLLDPLKNSLKGLSANEAAQRLKRDGPNQLPKY